MRVLAVDLGIHTGLALAEPGVRPRISCFDIPYPARDLGSVGIYFEEKMSEKIARAKPDVIVRATRFINRHSQPIAIGPVFGLSMVLDVMAQRRRIEHCERAESDARKAFLGKVPRKSKDIKAAVRAACMQRQFPVHDQHSCDAIVMAVFELSLRVPSYAVSSTPLFAEA